MPAATATRHTIPVPSAQFENGGIPVSCTASCSASHRQLTPQQPRVIGATLKAASSPAWPPQMAAPRPSSRPQGAAEDAIAAVARDFPGREREVAALAAELSRSGAQGEGCLVFGPPATGKSAVVRSLLRALGLRHAIVNCMETVKPRTLLTSVLHQLKGSKRQRDDGYECGVKCDGMADFKQQLPGILGCGSSDSGRRGPCWLVLENVERLAGSELLTDLLRVRDVAGAEVAVLLVSNRGWGSGQFIQATRGAPHPVEVFFKGYSPEQMQKILEHVRQRSAGAAGDGEFLAFRQFLNPFVPAFCRNSNDLLSLKVAVDKLFPLYMQPLRQGQQLQAHQLYGRIREEVQRVTRSMALQPGQMGGVQAQQAAQQAQHAQQMGQQVGQSEQAILAAGRRASSTGLAFELPYIAKFLLLAAYVASRNKPTSDRAVFDPTHKQRGRRDAQAHDRQVEAAVEAKLRGPHAFPLERLLHIFYALYAHHDAEEEEEEEEEETRRVMQQAEVLQQVSSLVALRLLEQSSGDVLEGQLYRCNLGEELAAALASNVQLRLTDYLRLG